MHSPLAARRQAQPTGVIETLSAGYAALNRQLWVLLLPIIVDVFLWFGPHVSYSPLVDPTVTHATEWTRQVALGPRSARNLEIAATLEDTRQWLIAHADDVNALTLVVWGPVAVPAMGLLPTTAGDLTFVSTWLQGMGILLGCAAASLLLGAWFYRGLAAATTGARGGVFSAGRGAPRAVLHVVGLTATLVGVGALLGVPVLLLVGFTALVSPPVALLGAVLLACGVGFAALHLFFAIDAMFVSNLGPLAAIQGSVSTVRRHLWSSVALIALSWLILLGMGRVWDVLAGALQAPFGVALGILGNAYIASGLIAAGMVFYFERAERSEQA